MSSCASKARYIYSYMIKGKNILQWICIFLVRFYQVILHPIFIKPIAPNGMCKYSPTCSCYMIQAIAEYGAFIGIWLGAKRIFRCSPFYKGGYDPVPQRKR